MCSTERCLGCFLSECLATDHPENLLTAITKLFANNYGPVALRCNILVSNSQSAVLRLSTISVFHSKRWFITCFKVNVTLPLSDLSIDIDLILCNLTVLDLSGAYLKCLWMPKWWYYWSQREV